MAIQRDGAIVAAGREEGFQPTEDDGNVFITELRLQSGVPFRDGFETANTIYWSSVPPP